MNKSQGTNAPENGDQSTTGINRREMVRRLMIACGAGFALPGFAGGRPIASSIVGGSAVAETDTKIAQSDWSLAFLDQHQSHTLKVLAERIIPGSSEAQVNRFVDLLLSVDTKEPQKAFVASLSAFEAESPGAFPIPLGTLLKPSKTKSSVPRRRQNPGMPRTGSLSNSPCAITLKTSKAGSPGAYYSSETGMKKLGWTGRVYFASFPGCQEFGKILSRRSLNKVRSRLSDAALKPGRYVVNHEKH